MIFENVYIQFFILHITYNQWWRKLPLPFGGAEEGQKNFKEISNFIWENEFWLFQSLSIRKKKCQLFAAGMLEHG